MDCFETQSLIMKYVADELSNAELEKFLEHIDKCEDCREELEICYILVTSMKQLDKDTVFTTNYQNAFLDKLERSRRMLYKKSKGHLRRTIILFLIIISIIFLVKSETSIYREENLTVYTDVEESDFRVNVFKFEKSELDEKIEDNQKDIENYVNKKRKVNENEQNSID